MNNSINTIGCPAVLRQYFDNNTINRYHRLLCEGKEATIHLVSKKGKDGDVYYVAKVFKKREERGFKNRGDYFLPQKALLHRREARAMNNKSRFGRQVEEALWQNREMQYLELLAAQGASVPKLIEVGSESFIMEYIGDINTPAPKLIEAKERIENAETIFKQIMDNIKIFLINDIVHGDLSPYKRLYHNSLAVIIDFPQSVDPRKNPNAYFLLQRDIDTVCAFFAKLKVYCDAQLILMDLWNKYQRNELI